MELRATEVKLTALICLEHVRIYTEIKKAEKEYDHCVAGSCCEGLCVCVLCLLPVALLLLHRAL